MWPHVLLGKPSFLDLDGGTLGMCTAPGAIWETFKKYSCFHYPELLDYLGPGKLTPESESLGFISSLQRTVSILRGLFCGFPAATWCLIQTKVTTSLLQNSWSELLPHGQLSMNISAHTTWYHWNLEFEGMSEVIYFIGFWRVLLRAMKAPCQFLWNFLHWGDNCGKMRANDKDVGSLPSSVRLFQFAIFHTLEF